MSTILFVHQSADLYGSDRVLANIVVGCKDAGHTPIVVLPCDGELVRKLRASGVEVEIGEVVKVSRSLLSPRGLLSLPRRLRLSLAFIDSVVAGRKIDIVHTNTLAVLGGALWAKRHRVPHLWHVHEIIESPRILSFGFPILVYALSDIAIANSRRTAAWLAGRVPRLGRKTQVVWNGIERKVPFDAVQRDHLREEWGFGPETVVLGLVGRINRLKGHTLLLSALERVAVEFPQNKFGLVFAGSPPPGQDHFLTTLQDEIARSPIHDRVCLIGFQADVWPLWDAIDIAVVPSTEPEAFGLVAIEAMASGKPVIAAGHGGLMEVVEQDVTGFLFAPNELAALREAIKQLVSNPALGKQMGAQGVKRQKSLFSVSAQVQSMLKAYGELVSSHVSGGVK